VLLVATDKKLETGGGGGKFMLLFIFILWRVM